MYKIDWIVWHAHRNYSSIYLKIQQYRFSMVTQHIFYLKLEIFTRNARTHTHNWHRNKLHFGSIKCLELLILHFNLLNQVQLYWANNFIWTQHHLTMYVVCVCNMCVACIQCEYDFYFPSRGLLLRFFFIVRLCFHYDKQK